MPTSIPTPLDREFASSWIDAWNSGDLERVFALYADDFEMRSPLIVQRGFSPTGALRGKEAIRPYWSAGITTAKPPLRFELIDAYAGVAMVAIHFRSVGRKVVIELLEFDERGLVIRGGACHGTRERASAHACARAIPLALGIRRGGLLRRATLSHRIEPSDPGRVMVSRSGELLG